MIGYIITLSLLGLFLYWLGGILVVPYEPIQQELINLGEEE